MGWDGAGQALEKMARVVGPNTILFILGLTVITLLRFFSSPTFLRRCVLSTLGRPSPPVLGSCVQVLAGLLGGGISPEVTSCSRCLQPAYPASDIYSREQLGEKKN